jgi:hypothetical protein
LNIFSFWWSGLNITKLSRYFTFFLLTLCLYLVFIVLFSRNSADNDLWGYLSFGRIFWEEGYFPYHDIFSYTPTKPLWVYHEWLTSVIFYFIYKYTGPAGLQLLRYVITILTIYLMYLTAITKGANSIFALIVLLPATLLISFGYVPVRAQIFTYFFFMLTIFVLEIAIKDKKWCLLWLMIPIQILWCNFHGGFLAGLGLIFLYALGQALSQKKFLPLVVILFVSAFATLINPYGFEYWIYTFHAVTMPRPDIQEWMSVFAAWKNQYQNVPVIIFISCFVIYILFFILYRKWNITELLVVCVIAYLGFAHIRHTIFFGLIFGAFLPVILLQLWNNWQEEKKFFTRWQYLPQALLMIIFLIFLVKPLAPLSIKPSFSILATSPYYPVGAINWIIKNNISGNILPEFDWGEFIIWWGYPACRVAMDGRYETVYKEEVSKAYFDFLQGRDSWRQYLLKYPHDMVLLKTNSGIYRLMLTEPLWQVAYADSVCTLFRKKSI